MRSSGPKPSSIFHATSWHMLLAATLLNTRGHTAAKSGAELPGPMPRCRGLTRNQQTQTPHLRVYQTKLLLGALKTPDNECEMMTHVMFKQDSGCVCERGLLKITPRCC